MPLKPLLNHHLNRKNLYHYFCITFIIAALFIGCMFCVCLFVLVWVILSGILLVQDLVNEAHSHCCDQKCWQACTKWSFQRIGWCLLPQNCLVQFFNLGKGGCDTLVFEHRTCFISLGVLKGWDFALFTSANVNELQRFKRRMQLLVPILFSRNEI